MLNPEEFIGSYSKIGVAHTANESIRTKSASGGFITTLLLNALKRGLIDGAIVTINEGLEQKVVLAMTPDDIIKSAGNKYLQFPLNAHLTKLFDKKGRFAVVALPCQINGLRRLENIQSDLERKIVVRIGVFCTHVVSVNGMLYLLKLMGIEKEDVEELRYKTKMFGTTGLYVRTINGEESFVPLKKYYTNFFDFFFIPLGCIKCNDMTAEDSDISVGKALFLGSSSDNPGYSLFIVRTEVGKKFLDEANEDLVIKSDVDPELVIKSQPYYSIKKGKAIGGVKDRLTVYLYKVIRKLGHIISTKDTLHFLIRIWVKVFGVLRGLK